MRAKAFLLVCLLACSALAVSAFAQEGHPLKGTWLGDWGPSKTDRNQVAIVMDWDGKQITGQINPGPSAIPIKNGNTRSERLDSFTSKRTRRTTAGQPVHYVVDGKIENLGCTIARSSAPGITTT